MKAVLWLICGVSLFSACASGEKSRITGTAPVPVSSELFTVQSVGFSLDQVSQDQLGGAYNIAFKVNKPLEYGAFIEVVFESPETDGSAPDVVSRFLVPYTDYFNIQSGVMTGFRCNRYSVKLYAYPDSRKIEIKDTLELQISSDYDLTKAKNFRELTKYACQ